MVETRGLARLSVFLASPSTVRLQWPVAEHAPALVTDLSYCGRRRLSPCPEPRPSHWTLVATAGTRAGLSPVLS